MTGAAGGKYNAVVHPRVSVASLAVALYGLGEAGSALAEDLVRAGVRVTAWDPQPKSLPEGVTFAALPQGAAEGADMVFVLTSPAASLQVAETLRTSLRPGPLYADCNTTSPAVKRRAASLLEPSGALFADVALMAPVPGRDLRTPALVSGPGAELLAARLRPLGMPVDVLGPDVGLASGRKLVRSVFPKGMAAAVLEALRAARALGCEDELYADMARTLREADEAFLQRLVEATSRHARRRTDEMQATCELLEELSVPSRVARASLAWLRELAEGS